jgi:hypothetical protein
MSGARPAVLALAGDAGGAAAMTPVLKALLEDGRATLQIFAYRQAATLWRKEGLAFDSLDERISTEAISKILASRKPSLLFAGTSVNGVDLEKKFINAARQFSIPSLSLLDFWSNYRPRFADSSGNLTHLPDRIAIMDKQAMTEMMAQGFERERLVVTGQPALDNLGVYRESFGPDRRKSLRLGLGVEESAVLVSFYSQPFSTFNPGPDDPRYPGYDEHITLGLLLAALERVSGDLGKKIHLVVRPHPREEPEKFQARAGLVPLTVSTHGDVRDLALASDLVVGMTTMLLVEAVYLGCRTLSFQPGLKVADPLPTTRNGLTRAVYDAGTIDVALKEMLLAPETPAKMRGVTASDPQTTATQRLAGLIFDMAGISRPTP